MSDKRPDDINPTHTPSPEGRPPASRPTPPPYPAPGAGKRPAVPPQSGAGYRRPTPDGHTSTRPTPSPYADRRPAVHPTTGERPKRRTASDEHPPLRRPALKEMAPPPRPAPPGTGHSTARTNPSGSSHTDSTTRRRISPEGRAFLAPDVPDTEHHEDTTPPRSRARRRTQLAAFNIVMIVVIAVIGLTVFAMSFESIFAGERDVTVAPTPSPTPTPLPINTQRLTGIITNINGQSTPRTITMMDIATNHTQEFAFLDTTSLADRIGIPISFPYLAVGNIMDIAFNPDSSELFDLRQSFTRDFHSRTGVRIDMENASITIGNDVLNFTSQTLVLYHGNPAIISDIAEDDIITIIAIGDTIWLIQIESSHGNLQVTNASSIINGRISINSIGPGAHRVISLDDIDSGGVTLPEGTYRITVEGTNIETYTTELVINHGEITILDLGNVEQKVAMLTLTVTPEDAQVTINGTTRQDHREPMEFELGETLTIRVEREGYITQERVTEMTNIATTVIINLEEEIVTSMVTIITEPAGANVWINNIPRGQSPVLTELLPGNFNIILQMQGFYDLHTTIYVPPGESTHVLAMTQIVQEPYTPSDDHGTPPYNYTPDPPHDSGDDGYDYGAGND